MLPLAFGFGGPWDMAILGGIVIVLFGGTKLAGLGKSLGQGIKEFKNATNDDDKPAVPPLLPSRRSRRLRWKPDKGRTATYERFPDHFAGPSKR